MSRRILANIFGVAARRSYKKTLIPCLRGFGLVSGDYLA
jgi:hypothetical protein